MKIKHTEKIEKEVEIKLPLFKREPIGFAKIDENGITRLTGYSIFYTPSSSMFFESGITELLNYESITEEEFTKHYEEVKQFHNGK